MVLDLQDYFFLINVIYKQINKRLIFVNKGIINFIPTISTISLFWFIICSSNIGSPVPLNLVSKIILIGLVSWLKFIIIILIIYCLFRFY